MMRISVVQSSSQTVTLRVEGEVKGRWVAELGRACEEALSRDIRLDLDLAGVSFVDIDGINLFRVLMDRQVVFTNPCPFIAEQLGFSSIPPTENCGEVLVTHSSTYYLFRPLRSPRGGRVMESGLRPLHLEVDAR